jgi:hypothetical protein
VLLLLLLLRLLVQLMPEDWNPVLDGLDRKPVA